MICKCFNSVHTLIKTIIVQSIRRSFNLAVLGILLVEAAGTIAVGDAVASDAEGKAVKVADSAITNGYALDAGTAGQEIRIIRGV